MQGIASFFERFRKLDTQKSLLKGTLCQIIFQYADISLDPNHVKVQNGVLRILRGSSALKNQLSLKKPMLLQAFREKLGEGVIEDIR